MREEGPGRRILALAMAAVLMALSLGMPLLDVDQPTTTVSVSDGAAAPGSLEHDHTLCMLYGAAPLAPAGAASAPMDRPVLPDAPPVESFRASERGCITPHRSRAPPSA